MGSRGWCAELIDSLRDCGFRAQVCLTQRADEELLHIMLIARSAKCSSSHGLAMLS